MLSLSSGEFTFSENCVQLIHCGLQGSLFICSEGQQATGPMAKFVRELGTPQLLRLSTIGGVNYLDVYFEATIAQAILAEVNNRTTTD